MPGLMILRRRAFDRLALFRHPDFAEAALTDLSSSL
jgi:hypothetical protein